MIQWWVGLLLFFGGVFCGVLIMILAFADEEKGSDEDWRM